MATQLALQRNFVTITPNNQIGSTTVQTSQPTTTMTTSPTENGEIVTITTTGTQASQTEANIIMQAAHTQVNMIFR